MLMKQFNYFFTFLLALLCGVNVAKAEVVNNYKMDFNTTISTSKHDFKVGTGWGHIVDSYVYEDEDDWYTSTAYVTYTYYASSGRDGSGALKVGSQTIGGYYDTSKVNDLLVTPKITGASSIYVKIGSSSSSIKFFVVNETATGLAKGDEIEVTLPELSTSEFVKVDIPEQEGKRIGIRADNVTIDDFEAAQADYELMRGLTVTKVINKGTSEPDCTAEGKFPVNYSVTVQNSGDLELTAGTEGYSLSLVDYNNVGTAIYTMPLTETLAAGATATVEFSTELDYATYAKRTRYDVKENLTNTTATGSWLEPVAYLPKLKVRNANSYYFDAGEEFAYGMITEATSKKFTICNNGAAPLVVTAIDLPEGFTQDLTLPATVAAHSQQDFNITLPIETPGIFAGNVTIKGNDVEDFVFSVSGTVRDASKYFEDFESGKQPAGTYLEASWSVAQRDYTSGSNVYLMSNGTRSTETKFITPLLKVAEGEKMTFDAARTSSYTYGDDVFLKVYYSPDRQNWTLAKTIESSELSSTRANYNYYFGALTTFVLDNIPAGNYYIGFGAGYTAVDNLYGFEKVDVAHDLVVTSSKIPATAKVNNKYQAEVTIKNINAADEAEGSYSMALYAGDEIVATAEAGKITANADTTFTFSYTPHVAGTVNMTVKFKSLTDEFTLSTPATEVTVEEETAVSEKVIGNAFDEKGAETTSTNNLFQWVNADDSKGAYNDMYYPAEMLREFGLEAGDKITGISYVGKPTSTKTITKVDQTLAIGLIDETTYVPGEGTDALTTYELMKDVDIEANVTEELPTRVKLNEPIVWDGTSALRVYTYVISKGSKWMSVNYPVDKSKDEENNYKYQLVSQKRGSGTSYSTSKTWLPVATLEITGEPTTFAGTVKCGENAVAGATVKLTSDDVIYSGTTDETGAYSFPVIQTKKVYTLTVTADKYEDYTEEGIDFTSTVAKDIQLKKAVAKVSGKVIFRGAGYEGATVVLSHKTGDDTADDLQTVTAEDGTFAFDEVKTGLNYSVKVTAEKFNDYASADSVSVTDDTVLDDIAITKPDFKVYGQVKWGETPVKGITVEAVCEAQSGDILRKGVFTDADGKYEIKDLKAEYVYTINIVDITAEFADKKEATVVSSGEDTEENFTVEIKPVTITVAEDGYMTYSYKRALDFSTVTGLKAYAVANVKGNYTELKKLTTAPANTGLLLKANAGEYEVMPVETADAVEKNLLVATTVDFTIDADNVGKAWALTDNNGMRVFKSEAGTTVKKGGAYLGYESTESIIYLTMTDGIHAASFTTDGMLDTTKPMFNLAGQQVGKDYKGVVIQNGKKFNRK